MKKILLGLFICFGVNAFASNYSVSTGKQNNLFDTTVLAQIRALSLSTYIGKPVDSLFVALPAGYTDRGFKPMGIGYCKGVVQGYGTSDSNQCFIEIFIDTFQFMTFPNRTKTTTWDMSLAKKETIAFIKVWKNNICIYGCNNPNYD